MTKENNKKHLEYMQETVQEILTAISAAKLPAKIKLQSAEQTFYMIVENMEAITIDRYYCTFYLSKDAKFKCTHKLNIIKQLLPCHFEYINIDTIVNTQKVQTIGHAKPHIITMQSGLELVSSIQTTVEIEQLVDKNNHVIS